MKWALHCTTQYSCEHMHSLPPRQDHKGLLNTDTCTPSAAASQSADTNTAHPAVSSPNAQQTDKHPYLAKWALMKASKLSLMQSGWQRILTHHAQLLAVLL